MPTIQRFACLFEDTKSERYDHAGFFCEGNEINGLDMSAFRMLPITKRFKAGETTRRKTDDGLIVHAEFVFGQRTIHAVSSFEVGDCSSMRTLIEHFCAISSTIFCTIHGSVCVAKNCFGTFFTMKRSRNTNTRSYI